MEKSLVTFSFDTLSKIARKTRFCRTYTKSNSSAVVFLCRQGLCNYVAPRIAWRTPAHQADARLFLQDNLHDSLLRKPLGFLRVPEDAPSVMVYKSFLVDHHFCFYKEKTKLFLNFPYLLGVWVGDKRHFEPYTFDDDIVSIYFRKYILILFCINHYIIAMRDFQESMTKISRQTEGEPRPKTTSKGRNLI